MFAALGIGVFLLKALLLDGANTPFKSARFGAVAAAPVLANFGDAIDLLDIEMPIGDIKEPDAGN